MASAAAVDVLLAAAERAYWDDEDNGRTAVLLQALCNYCLGWESALVGAVGAASCNGRYRLSTDQCLAMLQFAASVRERAEDSGSGGGEDEDEDDGEGHATPQTQPLLDAARRLQGLLNAIVDAGALDDGEDEAMAEEAAEEGAITSVARNGRAPLLQARSSSLSSVGASSSVMSEGGGGEGDGTTTGGELDSSEDCVDAGVFQALARAQTGGPRLVDPVAAAAAAAAAGPAGGPPRAVAASLPRAGAHLIPL
jgi:hypothetical protein